MKACVVLSAVITFASAAAGAEPDYLAVVRRFADAMIEHGRDNYGAEQSPLFAETLDRRTLRLLEGDALRKVRNIPRQEWGIRPSDRMLTAGNPQHLMDLYQVLYALTPITGDRKYAAEADKSLKWFFEHCQAPQTGLMYWGEHAGWDFLTDKPMTGSTATLHEFGQPWALWDRCWELAPQACAKFAAGLWECQIGDQRTGLYSRHAHIDRKQPDMTAPYARHGGFYVETWAKAYAMTKDPVFLKAIETVVNMQENARTGEKGMNRAGSLTKGLFTRADLSWMISLTAAAGALPAELAEKCRNAAKAQDEYLLAESKKRGTLLGRKIEENLWSSAYGGAGGEIAGWANTTMLRWRQTRIDLYKRQVVEVADMYLQQKINTTFPVHPETLGKVIILMVSAHELTGDAKYLKRADEYALESLKLFWPDSSPLPRASHLHDHFEAVTHADTLVMALLQLWGAQQTPAVKVPVVYSNR